MVGRQFLETLLRARISIEQYIIRDKMDFVMKNTEISTKRNVRSSPDSVMYLELTSSSSDDLLSPSRMSGKKRRKKLKVLQENEPK